jgi:hypothetical protein
MSVALPLQHFTKPLAMSSLSIRSRLPQQVWVFGLPQRCPHWRSRGGHSSRHLPAWQTWFGAHFLPLSSRSQPPQ